MTDNEIIKALECCRGEYTDFCFDCPAYHLSECVREIHNSASVLINRQKAQINKLEERATIND